MSFSLRATIRGFVAPEHRLSCSRSLWATGLQELRRRGEGRHESGAFILGSKDGTRRRGVGFVYYDDLDPHALDTGIIVFDGVAFGPLWRLCRETGLSVVADVHTHGGAARQSKTDRENPMIAMPGHVAIVVPDLARRFVPPAELGIYEYRGQHEWKEFTRAAAVRYFYVGIWG